LFLQRKTWKITQLLEKKKIEYKELQKEFKRLEKAGLEPEFDEDDFNIERTMELKDIVKATYNTQFIFNIEESPMEDRCFITFDDESTITVQNTYEELINQLHGKKG
jgi:hypothetical protein